MFVYTVEEEALCDEELGSYTAYGIRVDRIEGNSRGSVKKISDISLTKKPVEDLVEICNRLKLDEIHLLDVVEDLLP